MSFKPMHVELDAYKAALDQNAIVAITGRTGIIIYVNDYFCKVSGYSRDELVGRKHNIVNSGHHPKAFFAGMWQTISGGFPWHDEICNRAKNGSFYWVDTTIVPMRNESGQITEYVSIRFDITTRKNAEAALNEENAKRQKADALLHDFQEAIPHGVVGFDKSGRVTYCNKAYRIFFNIPEDAALEGMSYAKFLECETDYAKFGQPGDSTAARAEKPDFSAIEPWIQRPPVIQQLLDSRWVQVQERRSKDGNIVRICTDITEIKRSEGTIKYQAEHDPLTGLFNRAVLLDRLSKALSSRRRVELSGALVLIDLDNFKDVNDTLGHDAGDELLVGLARRFTGALRKSDTVARIGGDEFAVVLPNVVTVRDAEEVIGKLVARADEPMVLGHRTIRPRCSLGVTFFPMDGQTPKDLLKNADIALYQAKARGRGRCCFFDSTLRESLERSQAVADALRLALANDEIEIAFQPQIEFESGRHTGFEGLARWTYQGLPVPPAEFIPIAEETGLIIPIGYRILDRCLQLIRNLRAGGFDPGRIAVNVAASQLKQEDFVKNVQALLASHDVEPRQLEFEVTENILLDRDSGRVSQCLHSLKRLGVSIALDDFGTGYASLSHLKRFPVDRLKIDRSFVHEIESRSEDAIIVRAIINLAHNLGMQVVAEGIETNAQFEFLRAQGCDIAQGYFVGRPMSVAALKAYCACMQKLAEIRSREPGELA
ncbi:MAG: EAL domain-containing protein [Beijerinckiaceae bacterium]|nr:EAL domain-containing protein [Beijerinckiaceae bacterium]